MPPSLSRARRAGTRSSHPRGRAHTRLNALPSLIRETSEFLDPGLCITLHWAPNTTYLDPPPICPFSGTAKHGFRIKGDPLPKGNSRVSDQWVCHRRVPRRNDCARRDSVPPSWLNNADPAMILRSGPGQRQNIPRVGPGGSWLVSFFLISWPCPSCFRTGLIRVSLSSGCSVGSFGAGAICALSPRLSVLGYREAFLLRLACPAGPAHGPTAPILNQPGGAVRTHTPLHHGSRNAPSSRSSFPPRCLPEGFGQLENEEDGFPAQTENVGPLVQKV